MRPGPSAALAVGFGLLAGCGSSTPQAQPASSPVPPVSSPAAPSGSTAPTPECGAHDVGGATVQTYCGTATAGADANGTALDFPTGACELGPNFVTVTAGTVVTGSGPQVATEKAKYTSLTLAVGPSAGNEASVEASHDGTYAHGLIAVNNHGTEIGSAGASSYTITLADNRRSGRFQLNQVGSGAVTGSWYCAPPGSPLPTVAGP